MIAAQADTPPLSINSGQETRQTSLDIPELHISQENPQFHDGKSTIEIPSIPINDDTWRMITTEMNACFKQAAISKLICFDSSVSIAVRSASEIPIQTFTVEVLPGNSAHALKIHINIVLEGSVNLDRLPNLIIDTITLLTYYSQIKQSEINLQRVVEDQLLLKANSQCTDVETEAKPVLADIKKALEILEYKITDITNQMLKTKNSDPQMQILQHRKQQLVSQREDFDAIVESFVTGKKTQLQLVRRDLAFASNYLAEKQMWLAIQRRFLSVQSEYFLQIANNQDFFTFNNLAHLMYRLKQREKEHTSPKTDTDADNVATDETLEEFFEETLLTCASPLYIRHLVSSILYGVDAPETTLDQARVLSGLSRPIGSPVNLRPLIDHSINVGIWRMVSNIPQGYPSTTEYYLLEKLKALIEVGNPNNQFNPVLKDIMVELDNFVKQHFKVSES